MLILSILITLLFFVLIVTIIIITIVVSDEETQRVCECPCAVNGSLAECVFVHKFKQVNNKQMFVQADITSCRTL